MRLSIKVDRLDLVVWALLGLSAAAIAGMLLVDRGIGVRIVETYPDPSAAASATARIGVEFAEPVDHASAETRLIVEPAVPGRYEWDGDTLWLLPDSPMQPGSSYRATIQAGVAAESGHLLRSDQGWEFEVREPRLAYLAPANASGEIWIVTLNGEQTQLTASEGRVLDYAVSRDGQWLIYSVVNDAGGTDLWLIPSTGGQASVLVDCGPDRCTVPDWSPGGRWVAYSREEAPVGGAGPLGPPRVWTVAVDTGQTAALYQDSQVLGHGPSWSPDGSRLAFFDGNIGGIRVLELETGSEQVLPTQMGLVGAWAPDGGRMLYNVMQIRGQTAIAQLFTANLLEEQISPFELSIPELVDFGEPAWSPQGDWLVIGLRSARSGPARQLWLLRPDGSEARPIVENPGYAHGGYRWDPFGGWIAYQRFPLNLPFATPEVLLLNLDQGIPRLVAENASSPEWVP